ncbi:MAG: TetR/AcrR family transcriptional regulator [Polyangiaceae bacterium]
MAAASRRTRRRSYHHGDLERALVDASIALMADKGVDGFTLREAARRVGVSHAAAYRHFADKDMVLEAIAAEAYRVLAARLREAVAADPHRAVEQRLQRIATSYVRFALESEPRFRVMTRPRRDELRSPALEAAIDDALGVLVSVAKEGVDAGALKKAPPLDHAMRVYVFVYGFASLYLLGRLRVRPGRLESYLRSQMAPLLASLRAR